MTHRTTMPIAVAWAAAAAVGLTACTAADTTRPSPDPTADPTDSKTYDGPVAFIGDELELFALSAEEITSVVPEAIGIGDLTAVLEQISDGSGPAAEPGICDVFYAEHSLGTVGSRSVSWQLESDPTNDHGGLHILQFADEAQAQERMDQLIEGAERCAEFTKEGAPSTFDAFVAEPKEGVRALAGMLSDTGAKWQAFNAFASVDNVVVQLWQPLMQEMSFDAEAATLLLQDRAGEAHDQLVEGLAANPPKPDAHATGDPSAAWAEWQVTASGVGPIMTGSSVDEALAALQGAEITEPEFTGDPWTVRAPGGTGTVLVRPAPGGDSVAAVTVGNDRSIEPVAQDGMLLPAAGDVRVGALVADAVAALPGGTTVTVASSGDDWYDVATRDGHLLRFHADRDVVDPAAVIVGITAEDATRREGLRFSE